MIRSFYVCRRAVFVACLLVPLAACTGVKEDDIRSPAAPLVEIASNIASRGDLAGAESFYRKAEERDPSFVPAHLGLAGIAERVGNLEVAADEYRAVRDLDPSREGLQRSYGRVLLQLDRADEAREAFQAALDQDEGDVRAMNGLAVALDHLGDHAKAAALYDAALSREPNNLTTLNNYAYSLILAQRYPQAIALLEPHWNDPKATAALRQNLALAYGLAGMNVDAERVARMDLSPAQVASNMDFYRRKRAELGVSSTPYAELGTYATEAMAAAQIEKIKPAIAKAGGETLKPVVAPVVVAPGGTPRFAVRLLGCTKPEAVRDTCEALTKVGIPCQPRAK